jgi:hypothetical protein
MDDHPSTRCQQSENRTMKIASPYPLYDSSPSVAIRCPRCGREAAMADAYSDLSGERAQTAAADPSVTGMWVAKKYYRVIRAPDLLPWSEIQRARKKGETWGICRCPSCGLRARHRLDWPADAYFTASIRGRTLWAWNREYIVALRDFVASDTRRIAGLRYNVARYVKRVPAMFLFAKHRAEVVKKLDRLLAEGPEPRAVASRPDPRAKPVIR